MNDLVLSKLCVCIALSTPNAALAMTLKVPESIIEKHSFSNTFTVRLINVARIASISRHFV